MLSKLLPIILLLIGTGGGIGAGIMLMPPPEEHETVEGEAQHAAPAEDEVDHEENTPEYIYVKLSNQFVVPVVEHEELSALVVMSLSLEATEDMRDKIFSLEPKLRDVFLQVLFDHANMGGFRGAFTRSDVMMTLRTALREAAQKELGHQISDVLILGISRQDV